MVSQMIQKASIMSEVNATRLSKGSLLSNAEQGVNVQSGILHFTPMLDHGLFEVGPCFGILVLVKDDPVIDH